MKQLTTLIVVFVAIKAYLVALALVVPKQYDTSSTLLFPNSRFLSRLVIWDSVFFVSSAERSHLYEHEWAFSWMWSRVLGLAGSREAIAYTAIAVSSVSHLLAALMLRKLTEAVFHNKRFAETTALMYVLSPAGIFLVAGYTESLFALLSFTGLYLRQVGKYPLAGAVLGASCLLRGNGLLWGIPFLFDLASTIKHNEYNKGVSVVIGGSLVGAVFLYTQYLPWSIFCPQRGEWCNYYLPSIYGYVQERYWNVGLFRYWTPNNIPNFLFAAPVLYLMYQSMSNNPKLVPFYTVHAIMGLACVFMWHVQIITRISTCLPTLYWYMAKLAQGYNGHYVVRYIFVWITFQVVMWGAYLPPA